LRCTEICGSSGAPAGVSPRRSIHSSWITWNLKLGFRRRGRRISLLFATLLMRPRHFQCTENFTFWPIFFPRANASSSFPLIHRLILPPPSAPQTRATRPSSDPLPGGRSRHFQPRPTLPAAKSIWIVTCAGHFAPHSHRPKSMPRSSPIHESLSCPVADEL
jgi:hypothetical protein